MIAVLHLFWIVPFSVFFGIALAGLHDTMDNPEEDEEDTKGPSGLLEEDNP